MISTLCCLRAYVRLQCITGPPIDRRHGTGRVLATPSRGRGVHLHSGIPSPSSQVAQVQHPHSQTCTVDRPQGTMCCTTAVHIHHAHQILANAAAKGAAYRAKMAAEETQRARAPPAKGKKGGKQLQVYDPDTVARGSLFTACFAWCTTWAKEQSSTPTSEQGAQCDLEPEAAAVEVSQPSITQPMAPLPIHTTPAETVQPSQDAPSDMNAEDLHTFLKKLTREQRSKLRKHLSVETPRRGTSSPRPVMTPRDTTPRGPKKDAFSAALRTGTTPRLGLSPKMSASPARGLRPVVTEVHEARPQPPSTRRGAAVAMSMPVFELQPWQDTEPARPSTAGPVATQQPAAELHKVATCPTDKLTSSLAELVVSTQAREL